MIDEYTIIYRARYDLYGVRWRRRISASRKDFRQPIRLLLLHTLLDAVVVMVVVEVAGRRRRCGRAGGRGGGGCRR